MRPWYPEFRSKRCKKFNPQTAQINEDGTNFSQRDFEELKRQQDNKCQVCGIEPDKLVVDHDHSSGIVRGLLCGACNSGLGFLKDSIKIAVSAAKYLRKYRCYKNN